MGDVEEKLRQERRKKLIKKIAAYIILIAFACFITPYILLFLGIGIMIVGAFSMSPTINLLRFRRRHVFSSFELNEEDMEEEEKIMNIPWKASLTLVGIGFAFFIISLILLSIPWKGVIFML